MVTATTRAVLSLLALAVPLVAAAQTPPTPAPAPPAAAPAATPAIEDGSTVELEYTLTDEAGAVIDSNKGRKPLTYTQGTQQIIPGLEKQLAGLHSGDVKHVVLPPNEAYGAVDPTAQTEVPKESVPPDALVVGSRLMARNAAGEGRPVVVKEVRDNTVIIDLNHPLAGKTLVFDVKVMSVAPPKPNAPAQPSAAPAPASPSAAPASSDPAPASPSKDK